MQILATLALAKIKLRPEPEGIAPVHIVSSTDIAASIGSMSAVRPASGLTMNPPSAALIRKGCVAGGGSLGGGAVTGLRVQDFHLLERLRVFNTDQMNQAVFAFRRYEDASLRYTGIDSHPGL